MDWSSVQGEEIWGVSDSETFYCSTEGDSHFCDGRDGGGMMHFFLHLFTCIHPFEVNNCPHIFIIIFKHIYLIQFTW